MEEENCPSIRIRVISSISCANCLSVSAATDPLAQRALDQIPNLKGCQAHTSVMVGTVDAKQFKKLSIQATFEPKYEKNSVFFDEKGV